MGIRLPGSASGLFDPKIVQSLIEAEKLPIKAAEKRKEKLVEKKEEFTKLQGFISELDGTLNSLKNKSSFYKLKVESSHPDIMEGQVEGIALPGSYEFEVRGLAKTEKELAFGFPDKDDTPVGFGFMGIEREDMDEMEVVIEPGSTLQDVVNQINDADAGVKAMVINTKYKPDPYRLLVISEKSGKESKITIDEDTTFLEFKEQVTGRNLDVLFEDVPVTDEDNTLEELVSGVVFFVKRSEPGTRIQVNIAHDLDATTEGIKAFVEKYNQVASFINQQFALNDQSNAGMLAGESSIKTVMRQLQSSFGGIVNTGGKFSTISEIGITTDPKTGTLNYDESKVKQALAEDYDSVAKLFIRTKNSLGVADRLSEKITNFRDPTSGVLKSKMRSLDRIIKNQDEVITRKERHVKDREESIKRRFASLESQLADLKSQGDFLSSKFGGGQK